MRFAYLKYRLKKMGCYLLIIILLPYIITVFLSGPGAYGASRVDETMVNVKADGEKSGSDGGKQEDSNAENVDKIQIPLSEYCIGIMAREIPAVYEEEALKTQAVLVRTQVCLALGAGADTILEERYWTKKDMQDSWGADQYSKYYKRLEHAWEETNGQVLTYENALAKTPFCRLSNGSTRDGREALGSEDYPYLKIVDCPLDIESKEQIQTITIDDMDAEVTGVVEMHRKTVLPSQARMELEPVEKPKRVALVQERQGLQAKMLQQPETQMDPEIMATRTATVRLTEVSRRQGQRAVHLPQTLQATAR